MDWLVEHSCTTINRAQVGHDGKTPHRRLFRKEAAQPLMEFGEQILAKPLRGKKTNRKGIKDKTRTEIERRVREQS